MQKREVPPRSILILKAQSANPTTRHLIVPVSPVRIHVISGLWLGGKVGSVRGGVGSRQYVGLAVTVRIKHPSARFGFDTGLNFLTAAWAADMK